MSSVIHRGGCHCGRVRFELDAPARIDALDCNCSICAKAGFLHFIVPKSAFRLLSSESELTEYRWGTATARHLFCRHCGVKSFYVPRSNPDGIDVNVRCIDPDTIADLIVIEFDGRNNWASQAETIIHLA